MMILAGDIGGTKTLLALYEVEATSDGSPRFHEVRRKRYDSPKFEGLAPLLVQFLASGRDAFTSAVFAVAGPVVNGVCKTTNLPWVVDAKELSQLLRLPRIGLINDFQAIAVGIELLGTSDLHSLNPEAASTPGVRAVLGAGTGLGEALVMPMANGWQVFASEGGHADFAPTNELEIELLRFLQKSYERVAYERVLSGAGLVALYEFLVTSRTEQESPSVEAVLDAAHKAAAITADALAGNSAACVHAVDMFVNIYGAEAGNLALKCLPFAGLYVAGGIAPKLLSVIKKRFMPSFLDKGRMSPLLRRMPVHVILNTHVGLLGAANTAYQQAMR